MCVCVELRRERGAEEERKGRGRLLFPSATSHMALLCSVTNLCGWEMKSSLSAPRSPADGKEESFFLPPSLTSCPCVFGPLFVEFNQVFLFICGVSSSEPAGPQSSQWNTRLAQSHQSIRSACSLLGRASDLSPFFMTSPPSFPLVWPSSSFLYSLTSLLQI